MRIKAVRIAPEWFRVVSVSNASSRHQEKYDEVRILVDGVAFLRRAAVHTLKMFDSYIQFEEVNQLNRDGDYISKVILTSSELRSYMMEKVSGFVEKRSGLHVGLNRGIIGNDWTLSILSTVCEKWSGDIYNFVQPEMKVLASINLKDFKSTIFESEDLKKEFMKKQIDTLTDNAISSGAVENV